MLRGILVATLLLGWAPDSPDQLPRPEDTPRFEETFRQLQLASDNIVRLEWILAGRPSPATAIGAYFALGAIDRALDSARGLLTSDPDEFVKGVRLLREHTDTFTLDDGGSRLARFTPLFVELKNRALAWPTATGAEAAYEVMLLEPRIIPGNADAQERVRLEFSAAYAGTVAAERLAVDRARGAERTPLDPGSLRERVARAAGAAERAEALYQLGFRLAHPSLPPPDPTGRFLEVIKIVQELESGPDANSEWAGRAPSLVVEFYFGLETKYAAGNAARVYDAYQLFLRWHPSIQVANRSENLVGWIIRNGVARLAEAPADKAALVERFLGELQDAGVDADLVGYQRADFYLAILKDNSMREFPITPAEADAGARRALEPLLKSPRGAAQARALAQLAALDFYQGRYREAREEYLTYVRRFRDRDWAWVAAIRAAEAAEALGDSAGAAAEYEKAASDFAGQPYAVVLARVSAAHVRESLRQVAEAAANYRAALDGWRGLPDWIMAYAPQSDRAKPSPAGTWLHDLKKQDVATRLEAVAAVTSPESGLMFEARRAIDAGRPSEAIPSLREILQTYSRSAVAADAAVLLRRARFLEALMQLSGGLPARRQTAERELGDLAKGSFDATTSLAKLATAAVILQRGDKKRAEALTKAALDEWALKQPRPPAASTDRERDVAEIRRILFTPGNGSVYGQRWNAFEFSATGPALAVVSPAVMIVEPGKEPYSMSVDFEADTTSRMLFIDATSRQLLERILDSVGGTEKREWTGVMDTPNQPIGGSMSIAGLWSQFFAIRPGHWGGWEFFTYPVISKIMFEEGGTSARADFTIGYSGGTIRVVKENGKWVAKEVVSIWIT
ncbi:MAG: hypothetical protein ABI665_19890 [Vicinamibacterales bacterium]